MHVLWFNVECAVLSHYIKFYPILIIVLLNLNFSQVGVVFDTDVS
jgi:hypothetical protein